MMKLFGDRLEQGIAHEVAHIKPKDDEAGIRQMNNQDKFSDGGG